MCIDFEKGWNGFQASKNVYVQSIGVLLTDTKFGQSAVFIGASTLEIPRFTNTYSRFKQFAVSFWFRRTGPSGLSQGLLDTGNCEIDPSILISTTRESISVRFVTHVGLKIIRRGLTVGLGYTMYYRCVIYAIIVIIRRKTLT